MSATESIYYLFQLVNAELITLLVRGVGFGVSAWHVYTTYTRGGGLLAPLLPRFYCIPLLVSSLCVLNSCCIIAPFLHSPLVYGLGVGGCGHPELCCKQNVRGKISPDLEVEN